MGGGNIPSTSVIMSTTVNIIFSPRSKSTSFSSCNLLEHLNRLFYRLLSCFYNWVLLFLYWRFASVVIGGLHWSWSDILLHSCQCSVYFQWHCRLDGTNVPRPSSSRLFHRISRAVAITPITTGTTVIFTFYIIFNSLAWPRYLSVFPIYSMLYWNGEIHKIPYLILDFCYQIRSSGLGCWLVHSFSTDYQTFAG